MALKPNTLRDAVFAYLNSPSADLRYSISLSIFLAVIVSLNIFEIVFSSVRNDAGAWGFYYSEPVQGLFVLVFMSEYFARLWSAASENSARISSASKRWAYANSFMGVIDLLSFLPALVFLVAPDSAFADLRFLKLLAIVRVLKLTRYSSSLSILSALMRENRNILFAAAIIMMLLCFLAATGIYIFERDVQPDKFSSIPDAMWWSLVTLTTVGYGDVTPITLAGKMFAALVMVCGVGIAAMPAGIFASSFLQLMRKQEHERRIKRRQARMDPAKQKTQDQHLSDASFSLSPSERREMQYLMSEYSLSVEQAVGVVEHFRH
jgi:voltage-gated potassium channel